MSEKALTVGEIAKRLGYPIHKIEYMIRSRNIQPIQRAGNLRVFSEKDFCFIKSELKHIEKGCGHGK